MKMNFDVRKAIHTDIQKIAFINAESWKTTYRDIVDQGFLDTLTVDQQLPRAKRLVESAGIICLVAYEKKSEQIVGFICLGENREKNVDADSELQAIYILEEHQGCGIGRMLFNEGVRLLSAESKKRMIVSVFEANSLARSFYERQGGRLIGRDHVDLAGVKYPTSTYLWSF